MPDNDKYYDKEQLLEEVLKTKPDFILSGDFANKLASIADRKITWANYWNEFLIYLGTLAGIALIWVAVSFILFGANWQEWLSFATGNVILLAGISFLVVFILFADRVLLRYFLKKSSAGFH